MSRISKEVLALLALVTFILTIILSPPAHAGPEDWWLEDLILSPPACAAMNGKVVWNDWAPYCDRVPYGNGPPE